MFQHNGYPAAVLLTTVILRDWRQVLPIVSQVLKQQLPQRYRHHPLCWDSGKSFEIWLCSQAWGECIRGVACSALLLWMFLLLLDFVSQKGHWVLSMQSDKFIIRQPPPLSLSRFVLSSLLKSRQMWLPMDLRFSNSCPVIQFMNPTLLDSRHCGFQHNRKGDCLCPPQSYSEFLLPKENEGKVLI